MTDVEECLLRGILDQLVELQGNLGGEGASSFLNLTDTPSAYTGVNGYVVRVNSGATGLEFSEPLSLVDLVVGAGGSSFSGELPASEIHSLPYHVARSFDGLYIPVGERGGRFSRCIGLGDLADIVRQPSAAAGVILALKGSGLALTTTQLDAIGAFFDYAVPAGLLSNNGPKARLLVPVWANNLAANLIDWLHPGDAVQPTGMRFDGGGGAPAFSMPGGSIASVTTVPAAAGVINLQARVNEQWQAANWCMAYYTHAAPVGPNSAMIGGRNDAESGGAYRYFSTIYDGTGSPASSCLFSPGFTGGNSSSFSHGGAAPGLVLAGMHNTNVYRTRQLKAAGFVGGSTVNAAGSGNTAIVSPLKLYGFSYYPAAAAHGQPASLLYSGYLPGSTSGDCDAFATALRNLVIALGAPSV